MERDLGAGGIPLCLKRVTPHSLVTVASRVFFLKPVRVWLSLVLQQKGGSSASVKVMQKEPFRGQHFAAGKAFPRSVPSCILPAPRGSRSSGSLLPHRRRPPSPSRVAPQSQVRDAGMEICSLEPGSRASLNG